MEPGRVDRELQRLTDSSFGTRVEARAEQRLVSGEQGLLFGFPCGFCSDFRCFYGEEDEEVRAELLDHRRDHLDRRRSGRSWSEALRPDPEHDAVAGACRRAAGGSERYAELSEDGLVPVDRGLDEIHR